MKTESEEERFKETARLLDYGFNSFEEVELFEAGYKLEKGSTVPVAKGKKDSVEVALGDSITYPIRKGTEDQYGIKYEIDKELLNEDGELEAPIKKGDKVGRAILTYDGEGNFGNIVDSEEEIAVDLVANEDVDKKNWLSLLFASIGEFFSNLLNKN